MKLSGSALGRSRRNASSSGARTASVETLRSRSRSFRAFSPPVLRLVPLEVPFAASTGPGRDRQRGDLDLPEPDGLAQRRRGARRGSAGGRDLPRAVGPRAGVGRVSAGGVVGLGRPRGPVGRSRAPRPGRASPRWRSWPAASSPATTRAPGVVVVLVVLVLGRLVLDGPAGGVPWRAGRSRARPAGRRTTTPTGSGRRGEVAAQVEPGEGVHRVGPRSRGCGPWSDSRPVGGAGRRGSSASRR